MTPSQLKEWMAVYLIEHQDIEKARLAAKVQAKVKQPMKAV